MRRIWRVWRTICVTLVSAASICGLALVAWTMAADALTAPISVSVSPDKQLALRVFSAGQTSVPPDYRADVRFVLRRRGGWFWSRDTLVAQAALADGWAVKWTGARAITIEAGPLSWFSFLPGRFGDVSVSLRVRDPSPRETSCIDQTLTNAINGIYCFDALIGAKQAPNATRPEPP